MLATRFMEYLEHNRVSYNVIAHTTAYTASETASCAHIARQEMAKTVVLKLDGDFVMAVVPATHHVDLDALCLAAKCGTVRLATETELKKHFPDCEVGAMPPFGNLYEMPVLVDESLPAAKDIAFNACSHNQIVRLSYADFAKLTNPRVLRFAARGPKAPAGDDRWW